MIWTDEQIEILRKGCADGLSYQAISNLIPVFSRNACIGKAKRLGLNSGYNPNATRSSGARSPKRQRRRNFGGVWGGYPKIKPEAYQPRIVETPPSLQLTILEIRDGQCRYIAGDDHLCCGHPIYRNRPYCEAHCSLVYMSPDERRRVPRKLGAAIANFAEFTEAAE